jgi:hypothetical protein
MNNNKPSLITQGPQVLEPMQQACVDLLSDALEEAVKGRISSVALVVCMDNGIATVMAGVNGGALNIGCDDLKMKIHAEMFEDGNVAKKKSSILRMPR